MSAILKTPMIQQMLSVMTTTQVSSLLAMMDTDQAAVNYNIGMATNGIPTTLSTNPTFATISMERFYVMKTSADTPATAELHKETKKVTGALYQPTAGTPNYSFIEFGQDICRFWAFINGQALIVPETLSTVELRAEVLKRELENFSTAISCDVDGNVEIGKNLVVDGHMTQKSWEYDSGNITSQVTNLPSGLNCNYAQARVSNGKLSIVVSLWAGANTTISLTENPVILRIILTNAVLSNLYPYNDNFIEFKTISSGSFGTTNPLSLSLTKGTNEIAFTLKNFTAITSTGNQCWRFEFNFLLS